MTMFAYVAGKTVGERIVFPHPLDGGTKLRRTIALGCARNASACCFAFPHPGYVSTAVQRVKLIVMQLNSRSFADRAPIPGEFAFAAIHPTTHITLSTNRNPHLTWSEVPDGTNSFVLILHDYDVPSRGDDVNQENREVPASLPRVDFFHWVLIDIPATARVIEAGSHSNGVTPRGKPGPVAPYGLHHGINDYTSWFANDPDMRGEYYGYDGPCPPWNDSLIHHYVFTLHAIDLPRLEMQSVVNGPSVRAALAGHVLAKAVLTGTYTLNPRLQLS